MTLPLGEDVGRLLERVIALPPEELPRAIEVGFGDRQRELLALLHAGKGR